MAHAVRIAISPLREGEAELNPEALHYLVDVHRARVGQSFVAFDPESRIQAIGTLMSVSRKRAVCRLSELVSAPRMGLVETTLLHGASKGHRADDVVRAATALGVARIVFVQSERSQSGLSARLERWRAIAVDASRQCGRPDLPELDGILPLDAALSKYAPSAHHKWCCVPEATLTLVDAVAAWSGSDPTLLLVGPEGGFGASDERVLAESDVLSVRIARFVLRTELAAAAALSVLACAAEARATE